MISSKVLCSVPKSHGQFQSLTISSKVLWSVPRSYCQFQSLMVSSKVLWSVTKSYGQFQSLRFSSQVLWSFPKSYVQFQDQVAKFSSSVSLWGERSMTWTLYDVSDLWCEWSMTWALYGVSDLWRDDVNALWHERSRTWALHVVNARAGEWAHRKGEKNKVQNQKDAQRSLLQKDVLNRTPLFFSQALAWNKHCLQVSWFQWLFRPTHLEPVLEILKWVFFMLSPFAPWPLVEKRV